MTDPNSQFHYTRLEAGQKVRSDTLAQAMRSEDPSKERWLFISPHDDDACIGAGLWMQAATQAGANVHVLVVTDGRMGYCNPEERNSIVETRRTETAVAYKLLGVKTDDRHLIHLGYPDAGLVTVQGRRAANPGEANLCGYCGLQNALTYYLRHIRPDRVLIPTPTDLHPDHQITHRELMICLFHAHGAIWPELGPPTEIVPRLYEMAVYCTFSQPPNLQLRANQKTLDNKLACIAEFRSQAQIAQLVESVRAGGPYEYLREVDFLFYSASIYRPLFA
jgi:LmbE family N-acetylglucosaminyl deacetylase